MASYRQAVYIGELLKRKNRTSVELLLNKVQTKSDIDLMDVVDVENNLSSAHTRQVINTLMSFEDREDYVAPTKDDRNKASTKQVNYLRSLGFEGEFFGLTKDRASEEIDRLLNA